MQKRGAILTLVVALEIVIALSVALILINAGKAYGSQDVYHKSKAAKEIGLMIESLEAVNGNAFLVYSTDLSKFNVQIKDDLVKVYGGHKEEPTAAVYNFVSLGNREFDYVFENPQRLGFVKTGGEISVRELLDISLERVGCVDVETSDADWMDRRILVDLSHGCGDFSDGECADGDSGVISSDGDIYESEEIRKIGFALDGLSSVFDFTRDVNSDVSVGSKDYHGYDIVIGLHIGEYRGGVSNFKAYYNEDSEMSAKLACKIVNNLGDRFKESGVALIPVKDIEEFSGILNRGGIGIVLELGNINDIEDTNEIGEGIHKGVVEYFE